tara:strand:- start:9180 stop:10814 length:1635 start_codon:yes stop_codon:yes gene_type:complete
MGIPSYFVHIVKNHSNIIKNYQSDSILIHNLYIDSNSIIYDGIKDIANNSEHFEDKLIMWVCNKILYYINIILPVNKVYIAFDGVAPVAKLEQQRNRRYKNWYVNDYISKHNSDINKDINKWDTTAITPGTEFMRKLHKGIDNYFKNNDTKKLLKQRDNKCKNLEIIISATDEHGEGEHKIFKYIRENSQYHSDSNTIIYGLDADLIMLSLIHTRISENIYLFRETPHFISTINKNLLPNENYVLDIFELGEKIKELMSIDNNLIKKSISYINDYIFICFFLGNDFMPHFPAINIRTNGINILLETYKLLFGNTNEVLVDNNNKIFWKNLRKFITELAKNEEVYCIEEMKIRNKMEKKIKFNFSNIKTAEEKLMSLPIYDRTVEKYINIGEIGWQDRYYKELFKIEINDTRRQQICINYLEGLEWNIKYYTSDCPDWKWKYNYNYPPLLEDLVKYIPYFDTEFITFKTEQPIKPLVQLAYVLPRNSLNLLPYNLYEELILNYNHWYKLDFEIIWTYCKYFWESHILLSKIDIDKLDYLVKNINN